MTRFIRTLFITFIFLLPMNEAAHGSEETVGLTELEYDYNNVVTESSSYDDAVKVAILENRRIVKMALIEKTSDYVMITAALYAFSLLVSMLLLYRTSPHRARDIVNLAGLISVIFGTILLVLVVDTTEALTAPMGILGAIAGYLFGTAQQKSDTAVLPDEKASV